MYSKKRLRIISMYCWDGDLFKKNIVKPKIYIYTKSLEEWRSALLLKAH